MESQKITLPPAPKIEQKETAQDKRTFAVVPLAALRDSKLTPATKAVLAMICSYCNRAGVTHVSQGRIADDMHTSQSQVSKCMGILKQHGYIEILGKHYPMSRGRTIRVIFNPDVSLEDALGIASTEGEDLRPASMRIDDDEQLREIMDKETWTEEELKANKERLARLLIDAFKTPHDKPRMYTPVEGDTMAVKKIKQDIRSRMRQLRKEQYEQDKQSDIPMEDTNTEKISLYTQNEYSDMPDRDIYASEMQPQIKMDYEAIVVLFENELMNGVKSEADLHMCKQLSERGIIESVLIQYIAAHGGETVAQIGTRILGTGC